MIRIITGMHNDWQLFYEHIYIPVKSQQIALEMAVLKDSLITSTGVTISNVPVAIQFSIYWDRLQLHL